MGYSPRGRKESDTTERLHSLTLLSELGLKLISDDFFDTGAHNVKFLSLG